MRTALYWVLSVLAFLYLLGFLLCYIFLLGFNRKLKKRVTAFSILFSEKIEALLALYHSFKEAKVKFSEADLEAVRNVANLKNKRIKGSDIPFYRETISTLEKRLHYLAEENSWLKKEEDYETMLSLLNDLNANYRRIVATYNSDLLGYEYWRKQILYSFLFYLFGFREKSRIH